MAVSGSRKDSDLDTSVPSPSDDSHSKRRWGISSRFTPWAAEQLEAGAARDGRSEEDSMIDWIDRALGVEGSREDYMMIARASLR